MKMNLKYIIILFFLCVKLTFEHGISSGENNSNFIQKYLENLLTFKIKDLSKFQQANVGAAIISSAPIPIFILILIFNLKDIKILDIMSSFAAGALIGDVFIHNLPEVNHNNNHHHFHEIEEEKHTLKDILINLFEKNELLICWGILTLFIFEKIISFYEKECNKNKEKEEENKGHKGHKHIHKDNNYTNILISLIADFIHNLTDGMAIGAGFNKNIKIGISLSLSIFFHEIPHEIGDFSYLLKQNMNITNAIISQMITSIGSFIGVFISFKIGEKYSDKIICFASGAFLYLAINTIMGDLKHSNSITHIILQAISFIFGVYILDLLI